MIKSRENGKSAHMTSAFAVLDHSRKHAAFRGGYVISAISAGISAFLRRISAKSPYLSAI
ncbi:hypothetical protein [Lentibacillus sp. JNUCC-1]|uniref:hypothetical protein n=1 Tax=Lentibacillus sp. JNUCC-1 TaxID=2654513 RepID=UPI0018D1FB1F|nr:hypothetical protein [Lentibacillus sp. JNUCC-1]